ncbi:hypothetical protein BASA81_007564 [Batrachochytrium salamandrivorans]|nr:hypothetical protein BASA81_007564 [Batrachochytrium salamandrivorans]
MLSRQSLLLRAANGNRLLHSTPRPQIDIVSGAVILFGSIHAAIKVADLAQAKWDERNGKKPEDDKHHGDDGHH